MDQTAPIPDPVEQYRRFMEHLRTKDFNMEDALISARVNRYRLRYKEYSGEQLLETIAGIIEPALELRRACFRVSRKGEINEESRQVEDNYQKHELKIFVILEYLYPQVSTLKEIAEYSLLQTTSKQ